MDDPADDWEDDYDPFSCSEHKEDCDHADADIDIVTGQMSCRCGLCRAATTREIEAEIKWQAEYAQQQHKDALAWEQAQGPARVPDGMGGTCDAA